MQTFYTCSLSKKQFPLQAQKPTGKQSEMKPYPAVALSSYKGSDKLKDKVGLISVGDSGIGRSVAVYFAREGAHVETIYLENDDDARKTQELVEKEN